MNRLRVATYNIHKGVQGVGPTRRLEIHNLAQAVQQFDADIVCLQEVRKMHARDAAYFPHWPSSAQADFLAPVGYEAVYRTNAYTPGGEHGNAVLSRWPVMSVQHEDMSDHRFEQRGLLHAQVQVRGVVVHVLVVHLGLIRASRMRQLQQLLAFVAREVPADAPLVVAGDFNEWSARVAQSLEPAGLQTCTSARMATFPSRLPLVQLDHVYARGLQPVAQRVPKGRDWARMSDHLPLLVDFAWEPSMHRGQEP